MVKQYYYFKGSGNQYLLTKYIDGEEEDREIQTIATIANRIHELHEDGYTFAYPDDVFERMEVEYYSLKHQYEDAINRRMYHRKEVIADAENP